MSNDVVIGKAKRDEVITDLIALKTHLDQVVYETWRSNLDKQIEYLMGLPETVSLEGMDRWDLNGEWDRSREGKVEAWVHERKTNTGDWVKFSDLRRLVAPVQSGGVDVESMKKVLGGWHGPEGSKIMIPAFALDHLANTILAHLTTTQSAPSINATRDQLSDLIDSLQNDEKWCNPDVMADCILTKYGVATQSAPVTEYAPTTLRGELVKTLTALGQIELANRCRDELKQPKPVSDIAPSGGGYDIATDWRRSIDTPERGLYDILTHGEICKLGEMIDKALRTASSGKGADHE